MKARIYVFGFDNTIVDSESIIIEGYNSMYGVNMTEGYWFSGPHNAASPEDENAMIQRDYHFQFTPEKMTKFGSFFVNRLKETQPNQAVIDLLKTHLQDSYILTGSPKQMVTEYFKSLGIELPDDHLFCGFYNGSGRKEEKLAELQKQYEVVYVDDDKRLIQKAQEIVTESILVKHSYSKDAWKNCKTIG